MHIKFFETTFDEYVNSVKFFNLHPKINTSFFPDNFSNLSNLIFYGADGIGKYSQMLYCISKYSSTSLKYDKKLCVPIKDDEYSIRISDIHYEIDMSLLGCDKKSLWNEIFKTICNTVNSVNLLRPHKQAIIVCKNFQNIHGELLDIFYSYMQHNHLINNNVKFILITNAISFIPDSIINACQIIHLAKPNKSSYSKILTNPKYNNMKLNSDIKQISNIKQILTKIKKNQKLTSNVSDKIINEINILHSLFTNIPNSNNNIKDLTITCCLKRVREIIYDIFTYNLDVHIILLDLINKLQIPNIQDYIKIIQNTAINLKCFNNNYRPIFHLERLVCYLALVLQPQSNNNSKTSNINSINKIIELNKININLIDIKSF